MDIIEIREKVKQEKYEISLHAEKERYAEDITIPVLEYTPVTQELAKYHERLGDILHFNFFRNNRKKKKWYIKAKLLDSRELLGNVAAELEKVARDALLSHPVFDKLIDELSTET